MQMRLFRPWIPVPAYAWEATLHGTAIRKPWTQCLARSRFHLERFLSDGIVPADRACKVTIRRSILQLIQPSELWASKHGARRNPGKPATQTGFGALTYTTSLPTGLLGVGLGGDRTPRMIAFQLRLDFWGGDY